MLGDNHSGHSKEQIEGKILLKQTSHFNHKRSETPNVLSGDGTEFAYDMI